MIPQDPRLPVSDDVALLKTRLYELWRDMFNTVNAMEWKRGPTANRPVLGAGDFGFYYDETLDIPIWWNGSAWKNSTGTTV